MKYFLCCLTMLTQTMYECELYVKKKKKGYWISQSGGVKISGGSCEWMCWNDHQILQIVKGHELSLLIRWRRCSVVCASAPRHCYQKINIHSSVCWSELPYKLSLWLAIIVNTLLLTHFGCTYQNKLTYNCRLKTMIMFIPVVVWKRFLPEAENGCKCMYPQYSSELNKTTATKMWSTSTYWDAAPLLINDSLHFYVSFPSLVKHCSCHLNQSCGTVSAEGGFQNKSLVGNSNQSCFPLPWEIAVAGPLLSNWVKGHSVSRNLSD